MLSGFVGFAVISKVPNTLHTPLMSGTNAIHGIVVLGALIVLGSLPADADWGVRIIAFVALIFGTLNVIGGFLVTDRMLGMFKGRKAAREAPKAESRGEQVNYLVTVLYIVAFGLFILGLSGLTGPKTAVRGNWIAATGMGIAVVATLISVRDTAAINWILIVAGSGASV